MPSRRERLPWWARAADAGAIALLLLALFVAIKGGFVVSPADIRISVRSEWRVLVWAGILLLARHLLVRDLPLHRRVICGVGALARAAGPLPDDTSSSSQDAPDRRPREKRLLAYALWGAGIVAFFALLTAAMTYPQVRLMPNAVSLNYGDPLFSTWRLAWVAHQLPRDPLNLFNANIFHPEPGTLAFSDAMLVPALMAAPLLWVGVPQLVAYNLLFLSGFALSGAAMFLLVRSLTGSSGAALLAGFIFAFLPYRYMHYAHLELQMAQWMPLCLWALHRTVKHGRTRDGLLTGLFLALQTLSSWYYGIFLVTFMAPVGAALLIAEGASRARASIRALAAGGLLAALLVVPMSVPYFSARENVGERPESEIRFYSATPRNYLAAHPQNVLFGPHTSSLGGQERELFMGFFVPLIALVGLWPPLSAARIAYALGLVLAFDVSLGFNGMLYPWLHEYVLPYRGLRVPARMAMVVGLGLAILAGYGAARLLRIVPGRRANAALFLLLALVVSAEYRSVPMLKKVWTNPPPIYDALPAQSSSVLLELPLLQPDISLEPIYMYFSTFHWNALVNGYSGFSPPSYQQLHEHMEHFPDEVSIAELRRRGVTHVVVHGALYARAGEYEQMVARLDRCEQLRHVTDVQWQGRQTRMYRLLPAGSEQVRTGVGPPSLRVRLRLSRQNTYFSPS
jgi:hypothetical protein